MPPVNFTDPQINQPLSFDANSNLNPPPYEPLRLSPGSSNISLAGTIFDPASVNPLSGFPYTLDISKYQLDPTGIRAMRDIVKAPPGSSPWLQYQMEQDKLRQQEDQNLLSRTGASNLATQQGQLAMRGGLSSGATERLGRQNMLAQTLGQQDLSRAAAGREAAYRQQAEERQRDILKMLPQAEINYGTYNSGLGKFNVNQLNTISAAGKQAEAIANSGGGGGGFLPGIGQWWDTNIASKF